MTRLKSAPWVLIALCFGLCLTTHNVFARQAHNSQNKQKVGTPPTPTPHNFAKWEKEIAAFEASDSTAPPPKGAILFIGSSVIRLWKTLAMDFPDYQTINRGFGGSEIADSTHFAPRIIFPYQPKQIFLRAGGNDIHAKRTPDEVAEDFREFVRVIHKRLPKTEVVYIAVNPAPSRWAENERYQALNAMIRKFARRTRRVKYLDAYNISLTPTGEARPELFVKDMLHFNAEGYKILAERVRPILKKP